MTLPLQTTILLVASYLFGAIPIGFIVAKAKGVDIRRHGSGNPGATNVGRVVGKPWGILVLLLDVSKGAFTSIAAHMLLVRSGYAGPDHVVAHDLVWLGAGLFCVLGNIAPVFLRFKGGKGVATALGVILGIYPYLTLPALAALVVFIAVVGVSRYVSLGSIVAAASLPPLFLTFSWLRQWPLADHYPLLGLLILVAAAVLIRHRSNIGRLRAGTENRLGDKRS